METVRDCPRLKNDIPVELHKLAIVRVKTKQQQSQKPNNIMPTPNKYLFY